jgi:hypothetical protein
MGGDRVQQPRPQSRLTTTWMPCTWAHCPEEVWVVQGQTERVLCPRHQWERDAHLKQTWDR